MSDLCLQPRTAEGFPAGAVTPGQWLEAGRGDGACHATDPALGFRPHVDAQT